MKKTIITKISVVVSDAVLDRPVLIKGGDLNIIDTNESRSNSKLVIMDATQINADGITFVTLAVFRKWAYWKATKTKQVDGERLDVSTLTKE